MQSFPPGHLAATKPEGGAQLRQGFGFGVPFHGGGPHRYTLLFL
jgi:hypothetical protein